jgi:hypothetical protein
VSVALAIFTIVLGFAIVVTAGLYPGDLAAYCASRPVTGLSCSNDFVTAVTFGVNGVTIFAVALSIGMMVVRFVQKRYGWYWPLVGAAVALVSIYAGTALVGLAFT